MDFDLTEEQRLLRDSVDRLLADNYTFEKRRAYLAEAEGWSRELVVAIRRAGAARPAVCRATWRVRRRRRRDHAGHGGVRPDAGAGAVSGDGRAGRHRAAPRRQRGAAERAAAAGRRGRKAARLRAWRAAGALRSAGRTDQGDTQGRGLGPRRREERRIARRQRRHADRQRPHLWRPQRHRRHYAVPGRRQRQWRRPPLLYAARRHPGGRDHAERGRGRRRRRARRSRRRRSRSSSASSRPASRQWPPRRSARWRRCRR